MADALIFVGCAPNIREPRLKILSINWQALAELCWRHDFRKEKDGPYIVFASFTEPYRAKENILSITCLAYDIEANKITGEHPPQPQVVADWVEKFGWSACIWTTHSHTKITPRYRVMIALSHSIPPELFSWIRQYPLCELGLSGFADPGAADIARAFYLPSCPIDMAGQAFSWKSTAGKPLSANALIRAARMDLEWQKQERTRRTSTFFELTAGDETEYAKSALHQASQLVATAPEGSRNSTLNRECFSISRFIVSGDLSLSIVEQTFICAGMAAGLDWKEVHKTVSSAINARIGGLYGK